MPKLIAKRNASPGCWWMKSNSITRRKLPKAAATKTCTTALRKTLKRAAAPFKSVTAEQLLPAEIIFTRNCCGAWRKMTRRSWERISASVILGRKPEGLRNTLDLHKAQAVKSGLKFWGGFPTLVLFFCSVVFACAGARPAVASTVIRSAPDGTAKSAQTSSADQGRPDRGKTVQKPKAPRKASS